MKTIIAIPARYNSKRFPGKPLCFIKGYPMIVRVLERCLKVKNADYVTVVTDDERIRDIVLDIRGGICLMTHPDIKSGTDRVARALSCLNDECIIVNVQGDLPFVNPIVIEQLINKMISNPMIDVLTPVKPCFDIVKAKNNNCVKAKFDIYDNATDFFREEPKSIMFWKHIGIYAFRNKSLQKFANLPQTNLEKERSLEQLRLIENDFCFKVLKTNKDCGQDINTIEDLKFL